MGNHEPITLSELKSRLNGTQLTAAEVLVANEFAGKEKRLLKEIAAELGVTERTLYNWRQDPNFNRYVAVLSDTKLDSHRALADAQLLKLVAGTSNNGLPSIKALELYYKLSGKLVDRREVVQTEEPRSRSRISDAELERGLEEMSKLLN
ncbi:phBC6A51 family helix-turn-helix protein [Bacillus sp. 37MA]|uniref:phBC6A51 family helix-turn-helix protein n=1 Tax=Bacillus sp. 37MA TaxID=1132442 RepID=UPI00035F6188|nr:phBC6A51 family helix-turn-helix protein [Bacillus sp. 37MA]